MYGLPTTTDISSAGCFSYGCAKWLCDSLSELRQHETCVKDTPTILSLLQNKFFIWKDFDVLWHNQPFHQRAGWFTINLILDSVFCRSNKFNDLNRGRLKKLLKRVMKTTTFQFKGFFDRSMALLRTHLQHRSWLKHAWNSLQIRPWRLHNKNVDQTCSVATWMTCFWCFLTKTLSTAFLPILIPFTGWLSLPRGLKPINAATLLMP